MNLQRIAGECKGDDCPTLYETDRGTIIVQGERVEEQSLRLADDEAAVEIPSSLLRRAGSQSLSRQQVNVILNEAHTSIFRLESLPAYGVPHEQEEFQRFLDGGEFDPADCSDWIQTIEAATSRGAVMQRVHILTTPLTDYLRYECAWGYLPHNRAGEDIRILDLTTTSTKVPLRDWWLIDDELVIDMQYNDSGAVLARVPLPTAVVRQYVEWRDRLISESTPFEEFWAEHGEA